METVDETPGSDVVAYAAPSTRAPPRGGGPRTMLLLTLTGLALITCLRIEVLNARNNFYLPRDFTTDRGAWPSGPITTETRWRQQRASSFEDPTWLTRPLTPPERSEMLEHVRSESANNHLLDVVSSWALAQYPLVALLLIALPLTFLGTPDRRWRIALAAACLTTLACGILMIYRGYFTSLGF